MWILVRILLCLYCKVCHYVYIKRYNINNNNYTVMKIHNYYTYIIYNEIM